MRKLLIIGAVVLTGCATKWYRPGTTEAEFYSDSFECQQMASSMHPAQMGALGTGYQSPAVTNCSTRGSNTTCTTTPGQYTPPAQVDYNAISRNGAVATCLRGKGYMTKQ